MATRALTIGLVALGASIGGAAAFAWNPGRFDQAAAILVLIGTIVAGLTGLVGLVLARAPWGRWTLLGVVTIALALAAIAGSWLYWIVLVSSALAVGGLLGPWLRLWLRHEPAADAPGPVVVALIAVGPAAPLFVGVVALNGLHVEHIVAVGVAMVASWAFGRGLFIGIWGMRLVLPLSGFAATAVTSGAGQIVAGIAVALVTIASWSPQARHATAVITPKLREPVKRTSRNDPHASD